MKKAEMFCYSGSEGQYLQGGTHFEEALLIEFQELGKMDSFKKDKWYIALCEHFEKEKEKGKIHYKDILGYIFKEEVSLDYKFAEKLNLFDIIYPECFTANSELGNAIYQLIDAAQMLFIVSFKTYKGKESLYIDLEVCCYDNYVDCHRALITQSIKY